MTWPPLLRSAGVRLASSYALVFGASALLLILALWVSAVNILNGQVDAAILADAQGLSEQWNEGGAPALLGTIRTRTQDILDEDALYLVLNPYGQRIAGNLESWPAQVTSAGHVYEGRVERNGIWSLARLYRFDLPDHSSLLVGRDVESRIALRTLLTQTLVWVMLLIGILTAAGALVLHHLFNRMVSHVSETAIAISSGDLSRRVRLSGRGDEFDQLAETINDMLDRISLLMDGVRQVSNAIAHDLRTPITRARARLEDAAAHCDSSEQLRSAIERAVTDLDNITNVFQALLRISEIEAGSRRSAFVTLDVRPLLEDLAELYEVAAEENGLALEARVDSELPFWGDRELIQQAVANLLDNAIKFSEPGGKVHLGADAIPGGIRICVVDAGPGIPEPDRPRAPERFFRGETARSTPGYGLGLTLVRAVAQLHGGFLTLEDAAPGLRAVLTLPTPADLPLARLSSPGGTSAPGRPDAPAEPGRAPEPRSPRGTPDGRPAAPNPAAPAR